MKASRAANTTGMKTMHTKQTFTDAGPSKDGGLTRLTRTTRILLAMALVAGCTGPVAADVIIDFDTDGLGSPIVHGQIIDDEYANLGVTISAVDTNGVSPRLAVAFDSGDHAAAVAADDEDLETPGTSGNESGAFHNILIIQESGEDDGFGIVDETPDDEGSRPAGSLIFDFDFPIVSIGFVLVDIEGLAEINSGGGTNGFFEAFSGGGSVGVVSFEDFITPADPFFDPTVAYASHSVNRIAPILASDFGVSGFDKVEFNFGGSGGVGEVSYATPEPATALFMGVALVGVLATRRRWTKRP